jgi:hypothetical protein
MTNYSVDNGTGDNVAQGLSERDALARAQEIANESGLAALVYSDDGDETVVKPA